LHEQELLRKVEARSSIVSSDLQWRLQGLELLIYSKDEARSSIVSFNFLIFLNRFNVFFNIKNKLCGQENINW